MCPDRQALHGLSSATQYGGHIFLSGFIPELFVSSRTRVDTRVFLAHFFGDPVVPMKYAEASKTVLKAAGRVVESYNYGGMKHEVSAEETVHLAMFLMSIFGTDV